MILPTDLAILTENGTPLNHFPRSADWQPTGQLRLLVRRVASSAQDGPRWTLAVRHRAEDAATADIHSAILTQNLAEPLRVVIKSMRRDGPAQNVHQDAIENRFDREQRALRDLAKRLPAGGLTVPGSWSPQGTPWIEGQALRHELPVLHCLAANHALVVRGPCDQLQDARNKAIRETFAEPRSACQQCNFSNSEPSPDDNPIPLLCRPWIVAVRESATWEDIVTSPGPALILTDLGRSLQQELDEGNPHPLTLEGLRAKLFGLRSLAQTLSAAHQAEWFHLDLNPDNVCLGHGEPRLQPIDYGHSEQKQLTEQVIRSRVPLRCVDFAAPEMQRRAFPIQVQRHNGVGLNNSVALELLGLLGWPKSWRPMPGDLLEISSPGGKPESRWLRITRRFNQRNAHGAKMFIVQVEPFPTLWDTTNIGAGPLNATVYRGPGPAADLYSYGLLLLCWLINIQKPVVLRDELAVFERGYLLSEEHGQTAELSDENWLLVYRRFFGMHSVLVDEMIRGHEDKIDRKMGENERNRLVAVFRALIRIGVKCIVRDGEWGYASLRESDANGFARVVSELDEMESLLDASATIEPSPEPLSFHQFIQWAKESLPNSLSGDQRCRIENALNAARGQLDELSKAHLAYAEVRAHFRKLTGDIGILGNELVIEKTGYEETNKRSSWFLRWILWPVRGWFSISPSTRSETAKVRALRCREIAASLYEYAGKFSPTLEKELREASTWLTAYAEPCAEFKDDTTRKRYSGPEYARVLSAFKEWEKIPLLANLRSKWTPIRTRPAEQSQEAARIFYELLSGVRDALKSTLRELARCQKKLHQNKDEKLLALWPEEHDDAKWLLQRINSEHTKFSVYINRQVKRLDLAMQQAASFSTPEQAVDWETLPAKFEAELWQSIGELWGRPEGGSTGGSPS